MDHKSIVPSQVSVDVPNHTREEKERELEMNLPYQGARNPHRGRKSCKEPLIPHESHIPISTALEHAASALGAS